MRIAQADIDAIRQHLQDSEYNYPFATVADVQKYFGSPNVGTLQSNVGDPLKTMLLAKTDTAFTGRHLRTVAGSLQLETSISGSLSTRHDALNIISQYISAGLPLLEPLEPAWLDACTRARALQVLGEYVLPDSRQLAVSTAAARLINKGFALRLLDGRIDVNSPGIRDATKDIESNLQKVGLGCGLVNLMAIATSSNAIHFGQIIFGRRYTYEPRDPSIPFGFLFNLIVKLSDADPTADAVVAMGEAADLARDLVAVLDIEEHNKFAITNVQPDGIDDVLREVGLYEHLFEVKQWTPPVTGPIVGSYFPSSIDDTLSAKYGWGTKDALLLWSALMLCVANKAPCRMRLADLMITGLTVDVLRSLLKHFAHPNGGPNAKYVSPLSAKDSDVLFKPLLTGANDTYISPALSISAPAFYEALADAVRIATKGTPAAAAVESGAGTERVVDSILRSHGLNPTIQGKTYNSGTGVDEGECDFVIEDEHNILFVECKAKAQTRSTLAGDPTDAMLDYATSNLAAQAQALQHERLLRTQGSITFDNGVTLTQNGRKVTRLTVTLLDHGPLQDRMIFQFICAPILTRGALNGSTPDEVKRFKSANKSIARLEREIDAKASVTGDRWKAAMGSASYSAGQLAVVLHDGPNLDTFCKRIAAALTTNSHHPLLEYERLRSQGLA